MMGFGLGGVGMVLFWLLVIAVAILVIGRLSDRNDRYREPDKTPSQILKQRFAAGEISRREYRRRRHELMDHRV